MLERNFHSAMLIMGWEPALWTGPMSPWVCTQITDPLYADHRPVVQGESSVTSGEAWRSRSLRACDHLSASAGYNHLQ